MEDEIVIIECPRCGAEQEDFDGFGVVHCEDCGYCTHPAATDNICEICGEDITPRGFWTVTPAGNSVHINGSRDMPTELLAALHEVFDRCLPESEAR